MPFPGIYPSSFTNAHFLNKDGASNVKKFRSGSQGAVSSAMGSCRRPVVVLGVNILI